jgi:hypothetical protein
MEIFLRKKTLNANTVYGTLPTNLEHFFA